MPIIYFFGPDGSGKTTLSRNLSSELTARGVRVRRSWMRGSHTLVFVLSRVLSRFSAFKSRFNPYYGVAVPKSMTRLWSFLEYLSALPIILWRFILPSALGYTVVADRYVLDLVIWNELVTNHDGFLRSIAARSLLALASRAGPAFLVTADPEELARRGGGELNVLQRQHSLYRAVGKRAYLIDTTGRKPAESLGEVLQVLEGCRRGERQ